MHDLMCAVVQAGTALGAATTDAEVGLAYSHLNLAREELAKYAEKIETKAGVSRTVSLRF